MRSKNELGVVEDSQNLVLSLHRECVTLKDTRLDVGLMYIRGEEIGVRFCERDGK